MRLWTVIMITCFSVLCTVPQVESQMINRVNYGVFFNPIKEAYSVHDHWLHTFELIVPQIRIPQRPNISECDTDNEQDPRFDQCIYYFDILDAMDKQQKHYFHMLNQTMTQLDHALHLPQHKTRKSDSRSKRRIFGFIGELSHTIFGTATEKDVKLVASHVENLENKTGRLAATMANLTHDLSSFTTLATDRMDAISKQLADHHSEIEHTEIQIFTFSAHIMYLTKLLADALREAQYLFTYHAAFDEFLQGAQALLQDKLSLYLIPYTDIQKAMTDINNKLNRKHANLQVMELSSKDIYGHLPFIWTYKNNSLFITLKFPLVAPQSRLRIFKIHYFAVPLNSSTNHATKLVVNNPYFAVTIDHDYYALPSDDMILDMKSNIIHAQRYDFPLISFQKSSCLSELYLNHKPQIKDLCDFEILIDALTPSIMHIDHGQYLIVNQTEISQNCPDGNSTLPGCNFCIHEIKCLCAINSEYFLYPARTTHCLDANSSTTSHPVNLAVLQEFFTEELLHEIEADTLYANRPIVETPPFKLFGHNWTDFLAGDTQHSLKLRKVAQAVRDKQQVFTHLSEPILDALSDKLGKPDLFSWQNLVIFINLVLTVIALSLIGYLLIKINMMQAALTALVLVKQVDSQDSFYLIPRSTTTEPPADLSINEDLTVDRILMYTMIILSSITLLYLLYSKWHNRTHRASFGLEISNNTQCVIIKLFEVPHCPRLYHCQANDFFSDLSVEGCIFPRFTWNKGSLLLTHVLDQSRPSIPKSVNISWWTALKLRHMLKGPVYAYLIAEHLNRVFNLKICPPSCCDCALSMRVVESAPPIPEEVELKPLYPHLPQDRDMKPM